MIARRRARSARPPAPGPLAGLPPGAAAVYVARPEYLWADLARTVPASLSGTVAVWDDAGGNGRHATQSLMASRPRRAAGGVAFANGRLDLSPPIVLADGFAVGVACEAGASGPFAGGATPGNSSFLGPLGGNVYATRAAADEFVSVSDPGGTAYRFARTAAGAITLGGAAAGTLAGEYRLDALGARTTGYAVALAGTVTRAAVYNRALAPDELAALDAWLAAPTP